MTSRSEAKTERRKVWVNFYPGAGPIPDTWGTCLGTKATVRMAAQEGAEQVLLVESRPGDVVLSREQVREAEALLDKALNFAAKCDRRWGLSENDLRALLRGGR